MTDRIEALRARLDTIFTSWGLPGHTQLIDAVSQLIEQQLDEAVAAAREELIHGATLWFGEYLYCKDNEFALGEGHTPPSMVYERIEGQLRKALNQPKPEGKS